MAMADDENWLFNFNAEQPQPMVMRTYAKPPKEYKFGTDFRTFIQRFNLYCELNHIPQPQKIPLLFTLLDSHAFTVANNLHIRHREDFDNVVEHLTQKFDSPAGPLGNQFRLNNRKQLPNESLSDFVDALKLIAQRTTWNPEEQQLKIIETTLENTNDPIIKNKLLKLLSQAQDEHWNIGRKWNRFNEKIKNLDKFKALEQYSKIDNPEISKDSQAIFQLSQQVQALMALQKRAH